MKQRLQMAQWTVYKFATVAVAVIVVLAAMGNIVERNIPAGAFVGTGIIEYIWHVVRVGFMSLCVIGAMFFAMLPIFERMEVGE